MCMRLVSHEQIIQDIVLIFLTAANPYYAPSQAKWFMFYVLPYQFE
jgi:hypothetical protein